MHKLLCRIGCVLALAALPAFPDQKFSARIDAPEADAGDNQIVAAGSPALLNGSRSTSPSGERLIYKWALIAAPEGSRAQLSETNVVDPALTPDLDGAYVAQLTVCDKRRCGKPATTTVGTVVVAPVARAGDRITAGLGAEVALDGSRSFDPGRLPLTYSWSWNSRPAGSRAELENPHTPAPTFTLDREGTYGAKLTVTNAAGLSSSNLVIVSTGCLAPLASAQWTVPDTRSLITGKAFGLDGSRSISFCGGEKSYEWTLVGAPAGSSANLLNAASAAPSFTPDVAGAYVAQLIVSDSAHRSEPVTASITTMSSGAIILPASFLVQPGEQLFYEVTLNNPAPPGGVVVTLGTSNSNVARLSPATLTIPEGATVAPFSTLISGIAPGTINISAKAPGYGSALEPVTVAATGAFSPPTVQLPTGQQAGINFSTSLITHTTSPNFVSSNPEIVSVSPSFETGFGVQFSLTAGPNPGSATVTAELDGMIPEVLPVTVVNGPTMNLSCGNLILGFNLQSSCTLYAKVSGQATITSSDSTKMLLSTSGTEVGSGTITPQVLGENGGVGFYLQGLASSGSANITANLPGLLPVTVTIFLAPSGFYFFDPFNTKFNLQNGPQNYFVAPQAMGTGTNSQSIRPGISVTVPVTNSDPAVGTAASSVTFNDPSARVAVVFTPTTVGSTNLVLVQPPGYSSSSPIQTAYPRIVVSVTAAPVTSNCAFTSIGANLLNDCTLTLPPRVSGVVSTVTSNSPNLLLSTNPATVGSSSITLSYDSGTGASPHFYIQNVGQLSGTASVGVSTPGLDDSTITFGLVPPSVSFPSAQPYTMNLPGIPDPPSTLGPQSFINVALNGLLGPGPSLAVTVNSSEPAVGGLAGPVIFQPGFGSAQGAFNTLSPGTTTLTIVEPANFAATTIQSVQIPVSGLGFSNTCSTLYIGYNLEAPCTITLEKPASSGGLAVQLTANDPALALSLSPATAGAGSMTLNFPAGWTAQTFWIQNIHTNAGSPSFKASAPGYSDSYTNITLVNTGFSFSRIVESASLGSGTVQYSIYASPLLSGFAEVTQSLRPGAGTSLYVANLRNKVGTVVNPVPFPGGAASTTVAFTPDGVGTDVLCIDQPGGYSESTNLNETTITVTNP